MTDAAQATEPIVSTSSLVILGGFALLVAVLILAFFIWAGRGERNGQPDSFTQRITVAEIAGRFQLSYSPRTFWPSSTDKQAQSIDFKLRGKSPIYKFVWAFLMIWLFSTSVFLIIAGAADTIEIYRKQAQLTSAACTAGALVLCGFWVIIFRMGSRSQKELASFEKNITRVENDVILSGDTEAPSPSARLPEMDSRKRVWLWIAFVVLFIAWILTLVASAGLQGWSLPGPQYGTLLFVAPGYGLLSGWLAFAVTLNYGIATVARSSPDGTKTPPVDPDGAKAYKPSIVPIITAAVLLGLAFAIPDPSMPLPMAVALLLFTPRVQRNLIAAALCVVGIGLGILHVYLLRRE